MLKKNLSKSALVVALLTTTVIWRGTTAYAEDPNQAFTLDPMIVTAQRTETRDLDTPATTNIITEQNIKEAGYKNVFDAIEHQVGLTSTGYGDAGQFCTALGFVGVVNLKRVGIETAMMTRYDNFDSTLNSRTMNCACCGKEFFGNKSLHTYKRTINKLRRYYCSYRCFRQAEAELDKLKAKEKNIDDV